MSEAETDPPPLHPVAELAASLLGGGTNGAPYTLSEAGQARIARSLDALLGTVELRDAASDLLKLACWLDTQASSPEASDAILSAVTALTDELEKVLSEHDPESLTDTKQKFDRFRAEGASSKAPQADEAPPKGTIKLGTLDYPKRG